LRDFFLSVQHRIVFDDEGENRSFRLERLNSEFEFMNEIAVIDRTQDRIRFRPDIYVAVDSKNNVYFPEKEDEYIVGKYDHEGNKLLTFGREYKQKPYSKEMKERDKKTYEEYGGKNKGGYYHIGKYPNLIRYIVIDDRDYVWIAVGEWAIDCGHEFTVTSTIDIYDSEGNFLYTFQSPYLNFPSFIKNGRLYSGPYMDDNNIHVFEIEYKN